MALADLREYLKALEASAELVTCKDEVDWSLEAGAIIRRISEVGERAVHFTRVKGAGDGFTLLGAPLAQGKGRIRRGFRKSVWKRLLIALEADPRLSYGGLVDLFIDRLTQPIKPIQVATGPCKEVVERHAQVNLLKFPAPYFHEGDGGRYLGTWGVTIVNDPDVGWAHWGLYRQMVHNRTTLGGLVLKTDGLGDLYYKKYEPRRKPMPFALVFGGDPACTVAAATRIPAGVSGADVAGGLRRAPVQLVKAETSDILVPANAEIVIEGVINPGERMDEGPFGEYAGYRSYPRQPAPVYRVECVTHRRNPILPASSWGMPTNEVQIVQSLFFDSEVTQACRKRGWPVTGVFTPPWLAGAYTVVTTKMPYSGFQHSVASLVRTCGGSRYTPWVQICDDDIQATDLEDVFHALVTKCHPRDGVEVLPETSGDPFIPFLDPQERRIAKGAGATLNCTWPRDWDPTIAVPPRASFIGIYPKPVQETVLARWHSEYGFPKEDED